MYPQLNSLISEACTPPMTSLLPPSASPLLSDELSALHQCVVAPSNDILDFFQHSCFNIKHPVAVLGCTFHAFCPPPPPSLLVDISDLLLAVSAAEFVSGRHPGAQAPQETSEIRVATFRDVGQRCRTSLDRVRSGW